MSRKLELPNEIFEDTVSILQYIQKDLNILSEENLGAKKYKSYTIE